MIISFIPLIPSRDVRFVFISCFSDWSCSYASIPLTSSFGLWFLLFRCVPILTNFVSTILDIQFIVHTTSIRHYCSQYYSSISKLRINDTITLQFHIMFLSIDIVLSDRQLSRLQTILCNNWHSFYQTIIVPSSNISPPQ